MCLAKTSGLDRVIVPLRSAPREDEKFCLCEKRPWGATKQSRKVRRITTLLDRFAKRSRRREAGSRRRSASLHFSRRRNAGLLRRSANRSTSREDG